MGLNLSRKSRMFAAIERGDIGAVRRMLDKGYHPDWSKMSGKCALLVAVIENKKEIAELLIERGASFSANYYHDVLGETRHETLLHLAATLGHKDIAKMLIEHDRYDRTLIDRLDSNRNSALHLAAAAGHAEVVKLLLDAGFDPGLKGANGKMPVGYAFQGKHQEIVDLITARQRQLQEAKNPPKPAPLPPPEPAAPAVTENKGIWKLVSPQSVAHLSIMEELGYKITDVFNFASRERIRIVNNLKTKADSVATTPFDELREAQVEEALQSLQALGGAAPAPEGKRGLKSGHQAPPSAS